MNKTPLGFCETFPINRLSNSILSVEVLLHLRVTNLICVASRVTSKTGREGDDEATPEPTVSPIVDCSYAKKLVR